MADAASGTSVLVIGGGPIGALAAVVLIEAGVRVMVSEPNPARRSRLSSRGAHAVAPDQVAAAIALSGAFDSVICTVGSEAAMGQAVSGVQPGGRIVAVGVFGGMTAIDLNAVQTREIHLVGSMIYDRQDFHDSLAMLQRNVDLESFVTHVLPLEGVVTALTLAGSLDADVMKVAIDPSCSDMT
jgi:threonine dehydrogenase-like Zn-dependent dehydrogenase